MGRKLKWVSETDIGGAQRTHESKAMAREIEIRNSLMR